jgi:hypothetical protein
MRIYLFARAGGWSGLGQVTGQLEVVMARTDQLRPVLQMSWGRNRRG